MANRIYNISPFSSADQLPPGGGSPYPNEKYVDVGMVSERKENARNEKRRIARDVNVRAVMNSIRNIFTWFPGERILNPEFGQRLQQYLYEGITEYNVE